MDLIETTRALREVHDTHWYRVENAKRSPRPDIRLVVQRTLSGAAFFEDEDGRRSVPADHVMVFRYGERSVYGYPPDARQPYAAEHWHIGGEAADGLYRAIRDQNGAVFSLVGREEAAALLDEIGTRWRAGGFRDRWHNSALTYALLMALARPVAGAVDDAVGRARGLIERSFSDPRLNTKEVAFAVGVTREHLTRRFTELFGESPAALLRRLRLERVRGLLRYSDLSVDRVARQSGFGDGNRLARTFAREEGQAPSEFRIKHRRRLERG